MNGEKGEPLKFESTPPASSTSKYPAAVSQGLSPISQNASNLPQARYARSSAAAPGLHTPCVCVRTVLSIARMASVLSWRS